MRFTHLPNIILVVCDTLGAKHMSVHGCERRTTPYLERMSEDDGFVVYKRCIAPASWTIPSHVSLFTGLYPSEHNIGDDCVCMPDNMYCLPEILNYMGYATFGVTSNSLVGRLLNFERGFDEFYEMWHLFNSRDFLIVEQEFSRSKRNVKGELRRFLTLLRLASSHRAYTFLLKKFIDSSYKKRHAILKNSIHATLRTISTAKKIVNSRNTQKPLFLFLNIMETHSQYNPPPGITAFKRISQKNRDDVLKKYEWHHYVHSPFSAETFEILNVLYDREVLFLDSVLSDFYSFLKARNMLDNTLLIITSDHGELLGEHGQVNHIFTLYNELLHVPLLMKYPKDFGLRGHKDTLVQLHDVFSTISDMTGSPMPTPESSHSLLSSTSRKIAYSQLLSCDHTIHKFRRANPSFVIQDFMQPYKSLVTDDMMKIIKRADGQTEMYDLNNDFYETRDLNNDPAYAGQKINLSQLLA
jgi:arylsulfatase A-like enzyme